MRVGAVAQMGEHLLCKQGVTGSIPVGSTRRIAARTQAGCERKLRRRPPKEPSPLCSELLYEVM